MAIRSTSNNNDKKILLVLSAICLFIFVALGVIVVGTDHVNSSKAGKEKEQSAQVTTTSKAIEAICKPTDYKEACVNSLKSSKSNDPKDLIQQGVKVALEALKGAIKNSTELKGLAKDSRTSQALDNCEELLGSSFDDLRDSFRKLKKYDRVSKFDDYIDDLKIWLSGAVTFQDSCIDEFENITNNDAGEKMKKLLQATREFASNSLAMVTGLSLAVNSFFQKRSLLSLEDGNRTLLDKKTEFPSWISFGRRNLLQETKITADAVVAQDGSGKFKTITDALSLVPKKNNKTFVVYIKEGIYVETVIVTKHMTNVVFIGDGPTKTKITGDENYVDGTQTMRTATVTILGANFIAKDIGFENSAGAIKHQAVALRVAANKAIFHNCRMDGYQDTLYAHAHAQFYSECTITGTIDFIFGDAAAIFQNCIIIIKKPLDNQNCLVTASGRNNAHSVTGLVLQNCTITGAADYLPVKGKNKGYLGRPWKEYSRTLFMQSYIDDVIQPEGWFPWSGDFALNTCWYGEYGNRGPGAVQTGRVTWKGVKKVTEEEANSFTVAAFINDDWIKPANVPYTLGMVKV